MAESGLQTPLMASVLGGKPLAVKERFKLNYNQFAMRKILNSNIIIIKNTS